MTAPLSPRNWAKRAFGALVRATSPVRPGLSLKHWDLKYVPGAGLALEEVPLRDLARHWGSPLHVVSMARLRENAAAFTEPPPGAEAGCEVYYSYKSNCVPGVLRILYEAGLGAEVISHYELWLARRLGVPPERIIYNGPAKSVESIRQALDSGIQLLNLNHREEIQVVARVAQELGVRARVGLRICSGQGWFGQFGTPVAGGAALEAYREALATPSLEVVGVHAHRGGMIRTEADLDAFVDSVLAFVDVLDSTLGFAPPILNFGGSLCTPTVNVLRYVDYRLNRAFAVDVPVPVPESALSIRAYVARLVGRVETWYRARGRARPRIFLEPGRSATGNAQMLLATVMTLKANGETTYAVLDTGINHAEPVTSEYHQLFAVNRFDEPATQRYALVGPICTPGDTLYPSVLLPRLTSGDTLAIMDSGAYFVPFSTSFSFPRPAIVLVSSSRASLLRRAESFDDLVRNDEA